MKLQSSRFFSPLFFSLIAFIILTAVALAELALDGYSGFEDQLPPISLVDGCPNEYIRNRYTLQAIQKMLQISYLSIAGSSFLGMVALLILIGMICREEKIKRQYIKLKAESEEASHQLNSSLNSYQIKSLHLCVILAIMSSFLPLYYFLMLLLQSTSQSCQLNIETRQIQMITVLAGTILGLSLGILILLRALRSELQKIQFQNQAVIKQSNQLQQNQKKVGKKNKISNSVLSQDEEQNNQRQFHIEIQMDDSLPKQNSVIIAPNANLL